MSQSSGTNSSRPRRSVGPGPPASQPALTYGWSIRAGCRWASDHVVDHPVRVRVGGVRPDGGDPFPVGVGLEGAPMTDVQGGPGTVGRRRSGRGHRTRVGPAGQADPARRQCGGVSAGGVSAAAPSRPVRRPARPALVGPGERAGPEEPAVGRHRRRMGRGDHRDVAERRPQRLRVPAPQDRHQWAAPLHQGRDGPVGDRLPALAAVRRRSCPGATVSTRLSSSTPASAHPVRSPCSGGVDAQIGRAARGRCWPATAGSAGRAASTANDSPIGWPGVGYGSCPTISTRTSSNGRSEGPQHVFAGRQVAAPGRRSRPAGTRPSRRWSARPVPRPRPSPGR